MVVVRCLDRSSCTGTVTARWTQSHTGEELGIFNRSVNNNTFNRSVNTNTMCSREKESGDVQIRAPPQLGRAKTGSGGRRAMASVATW